MRNNSKAPDTLPADFDDFDEDVDTFMAKRRARLLFQGAPRRAGGMTARQAAFWRFTDLLKAYAKRRIKLGIN